MKTFKHTKDAFTLMELIIGMVLMGIIILAVFSFEIVSREIFRSSERKSIVSDEAAFVLDHIQKYVWDGEGGGANPDALSIIVGVDQILCVRNTTNWLGNYTFDFTNHQVVFKKGGVDYPLTQRLYNDAANPFEIDVVGQDGGVRIRNFTLMYNPNENYNARNNPMAVIKGIYFYPYGQKL
ncbi:MAG: prepilin-type N-terminal cleavage/methylation domain-containing protein [Candidatus Omnitrophota bacterium]|nr:prepilin-type N-terminal cleavage/methylation domain-containing protein [Candidatus Omnitrophota bacterium]